MIENEILILRRIQNEHIIQFYEVYEDKESIYLIFELLEGDILIEEDDEGNIHKNYDADDVKEVMKQVIKGLIYLDEMGIMHRDLKPENIIFKYKDKSPKENIAKIIDFGLAERIQKCEYILTKCGTPGYIAPEIFDCKENSKEINYDNRCDIFSLGAMFYFLICSEPAFSGNNVTHLMINNEKCHWEYPYLEKEEKEEAEKKFGSLAFDLLEKMMDKNPDERIHINEILTHPYFKESEIKENNTKNILKQKSHLDSYKKNSLFISKASLKKMISFGNSYSKGKVGSFHLNLSSIDYHHNYNDEAQKNLFISGANNNLTAEFFESPINNNIEELRSPSPEFKNIMELNLLGLEGSGKEIKINGNQNKKNTSLNNQSLFERSYELTDEFLRERNEEEIEEKQIYIFNTRGIRTIK